MMLEMEKRYCKGDILMELNDENPHKRIEAVKRLDSQEILADVAKSDCDCRVRFQAVKRISDERVLAEIAQNDSNVCIRKTGSFQN